MQDFQTIDRRRVGRDLAALAMRAKELKKPLRSRWLRPMHAEQRELAELSRRTTALCVLRAFLRGRRHFQKPPRGWPPESAWDSEAYHARIAERTAREYLLSVEQAS